MATGVGEYLVRQAHRRGLVLFVEENKQLRYYPKRHMTEAFNRLLTAHYWEVVYWIITDAVTQE